VTLDQISLVDIRIKATDEAVGKPSTQIQAIDITELQWLKAKVYTSMIFLIAATVTAAMDAEGGAMRMGRGARKFSGMEGKLLTSGYRCGYAGAGCDKNLTFLAETSPNSRFLWVCSPSHLPQA